MAKTFKGTNRDNRQRILDAAMALIGEKGVEKTSLAQISARSGISKGTLYYYYATKNDLIFDIADLHMERITFRLTEMIDLNKALTWEDLLTEFFTTLLTLEERSRLHIYLVREAISGNQELKKRFQATYAEWFDMVADSYTRMSGGTPDTAAKAKLLVAVVDGFILQVLLETGQTDIQDIVRLMLKAIWEPEPE